METVVNSVWLAWIQQSLLHGVVTETMVKSMCGYHGNNGQLHMWLSWKQWSSLHVVVMETVVNCTCGCHRNNGQLCMRLSWEQWSSLHLVVTAPNPFQAFQRPAQHRRRLPDSILVSIDLAHFRKVSSTFSPVSALVSRNISSVERSKTSKLQPGEEHSLTLLGTSRSTAWCVHTIETVPQTFLAQAHAHAHHSLVQSDWLPRT